MMGQRKLIETASCRRQMSAVSPGSALRQAQAGMTLVEVTIATVIFAMIMLGVVTAMRTFAQTYDRLQVVTAQTSVKREVDRFLRSALRDALGEAGYFDGDSRGLQWVAPIDRVGSAGGLQHLRLSARGTDLMLSFAPFDRFAEPDDEPDWDSAVPPAVLLDDLQSLRVTYRMLPEENWERSAEASGDEGNSQALPWAVQLNIVTNDGEWPPLIVVFEQYELRL